MGFVNGEARGGFEAGAEVLKEGDFDLVVSDLVVEDLLAWVVEVVGV